jgi:hypothetical protein
MLRYHDLNRYLNFAAITREGGADIIKPIATSRFTGRDEAAW